MTFVMAAPINPFRRCLYYRQTHIRTHGHGHNTSAHIGIRSAVGSGRSHRYSGRYAAFDGGLWPY